MSLRHLRLLRWAVDPAALMADAGMDPSPFQAEVLREAARSNGFRGVLLTARQCGKSTVQSCLAVWFALCRPGRDVLIICPTMKQSVELMVKVHSVVRALGLRLAENAATKIRIQGGARVICLPASGHIRGYTAELILVDEGSWVPDVVMFESIMPMLAAVPGGGCMVAASTPNGEAGWFHDWFVSDKAKYRRWRVPWWEVPRISKEYAEEFRAGVPERTWRQEMECVFEGTGAGFWNPRHVDAAFVPDDQLGVDLSGMPESMLDLVA